MSANGLLFIHALTGLHPGSGTALGVVDLPVQRERHTQWPIIPGSALKGILRDACREKIKENFQDDGPEEPEDKRRSRRAKADADLDLVVIFGPPTDSSSEHAGALSVTDARILAFPVRSLKGVFAWVTCPAVLERLKRDMALAGLEDGIKKLPKVDNNQALCANPSPLVVDNDKLVLEEFEFTQTGTLDGAADWISQAVTDQVTAERLKNHLVVLHDDDFTHFVRHATEVAARIGLDYEKKTVRQGALFYEEFLPPETIFYSVVLAKDSRRKGRNKSAAEILADVKNYLPPVLQIGADETIGKGFCAVKLYQGKE